MFLRRLILGCLVSLVPLGIAATAARAAVVHEFKKGPTEAISREAETCSGPGVRTGPLHDPWALAVDPGEGLGEQGHVWVAEIEEGVERVDAFNGVTGSCEVGGPVGVGQLANVGSLQLEGFGGVAVGHATGEREVYVGTYEQHGGGEDLVAVFGPSGGLQHVWSGAGTPVGSFAASAVNANLEAVAVDESKAFGDWATGDVLVAVGGDSCPVGDCGVVDVLAPVAGGSEPTEGWQLRGTCEETGETATGLTPCAGSKFVPFAGPRAVAVDQQNGELFVADGSLSDGREYVVDMFMPGAVAGEYEYVGQLTPPGGFPGQVEGVAVDGGARGGLGDVYVVDEGVVYELDLSTGEVLERLGSGVSVAVDPSSHDVYVGQSCGRCVKKRWCGGCVGSGFGDSGCGGHRTSQ